MFRLTVCGSYCGVAILYKPATNGDLLLAVRVRDCLLLLPNSYGGYQVCGPAYKP